MSWNGHGLQRQRLLTMSKKFDEVRVHTTDSVVIPAKNKQAIIDEWTDALATRMASETT